MKKFSPLEVLALNDLPEGPRVARTAYLCRKYGWNPRTLQGSKEILENLGEPRGAKTRLKRELRSEFARQLVKAGRRLSAARPYKRSFTHCEAYDPAAFKAYLLRFGCPGPATKKDRIKAICAARLHRPILGSRTNTASDVLPYWAGHWWDGYVDCSAIWDAAFMDGGYFTLIRPSYVRAPGQRTLHYNHNYRWLVFKVGSLVKAIRVSGRASNMAQALLSLKTSHVKKAEEKGYEVKVDWEREIFIVMSPRRRKPRELPFKKHSRTIKQDDDA